MSRDRALARVVADAGTVSVSGRYYRFTARRRVPYAFDGSDRGGRWGPPATFRVLYLADDYEACVIEAYRHSTDNAMDPAQPPVRLGLVGCIVEVTNILDLTKAATRVDLGLDPAILFSEPQDPATGAAYLACGAVAQAAHQIGRHGLLVPSATQRGTTLALFTDLLPDHERPQRAGGVSTWEALPPDPRQLRIVHSEES
ncbi:hypothetical protein GCM10009795_005080 [Nocardioides hankookensis]|uniref:RES family NAD+ phosphorylase n=1 Tax=Nocardioides hankookensis TaxID=443157 RepID=A0ABW1LNX0_9ACTN